MRGIRLALERPQLLADQLEALCRTAADHPVSVMFPMVATVDELLRARQVLAGVAGPGGPPPSLRIGSVNLHLDLRSTRGRNHQWRRQRQLHHSRTAHGKPRRESQF